MEELLARIRAAFASYRCRNPGEPVLAFGPLQIDLPAHIVTVDGEEVHPTPTEYELLGCWRRTMRRRVMTHQILLTRVWGPASEDSTNYLRVYINQLRRKISEPDPARPRYILTDPGIGYPLPAAGRLQGRSG
ncbi:MAG: winged helix-turn-helix domain-containing protein [Thermomicrobiales bacterium]